MKTFKQFNEGLIATSACLAGEVTSYAAIGDYENAIIISNWAKDNNLKNITVITSYYHMPRSLLLLTKMSFKQNFHPYPVKQNNLLHKASLIDSILYYFFLTEEYIKYMLSHFIVIFTNNADS